VGVPPAGGRLEFGAFTLVPVERVILKDGEPVALAPKAFDLLSFFAANPARLLTKDELLRAVWPDAIVEESNLAYHVSALRRALDGADEASSLIETIPKRGYRFVAPVVHAGQVVRANGARGSVLRFQEPLWGRPSASMTFSISPDGQHLLMAIQGEDGAAKLWVRTLSEPAPRPVIGSEGFITPPAIWSPRGDAVAFAHGGPLKRVTLAGGMPHAVCELPAIAVGGSWNREDVILVGNPLGPLLQCRASGGSPTPVTKIGNPPEVHLMPAFLSDGQRFIYLRVCRHAPERSGVYVGHLDEMSSPDEASRLIETGFNAAFVPESDEGSSAVVFLRDRALFGQRFDETRLALRGPAIQLADDVGSFLDAAFFSVSSQMLVYRAPDPLYQLTWVDREGRDLKRVGLPEPVAGLALSPADDRALVVRHTPHNAVELRLWLFDVARDANPHRLTSGGTIELWPSWIDNGRFAYGLGGGLSGVYEQTINGPRRLWFQGGGNSGVTAACGGRVAVFVGEPNPLTRTDLWVWTEHGPANGRPLIVREGDQEQAQLAPDGRWLAYVSNETGRYEVFVASFRYDESSGAVSVGDSISVSDGGGFAPRWRADTKELFYLKLDGSVMVLDVDPTVGVTPGAGRLRFTRPNLFHEWGVNCDGTRFLLAVPTAPPPPLQIVQNWQALLPE
jgi:DNA-binding winged helix-turn-helix (wHTH) protein